MSSKMSDRRWDPSRGHEEEKEEARHQWRRWEEKEGAGVADRRWCEKEAAWETRGGRRRMK